MTDISGLGIQGLIVTASSKNYEESIARHSATSVLHPAYVVYPISPEDVARALLFALSQTPPLQVAVKGGGCHTSTVSSTEGGLVLDLSRIKSVTVSDDNATVAVGGGAVWGDVYTELDKHKLVTTGGNVTFLGVGGCTTAGGFSHLSGKYGLAVDNLVAAAVVLADGKVIKTSESEEPDLFWAIRGGSNQFGIVTEFVFKTYPAPGPALVGVLAYPGTEIQNVLKVFREYLQAHTEQCAMDLAFMRTPPDFHPSIAILPYIPGDVESTTRILAPFRTKVTPIVDQTGFAPNYSAVAHGADAALAAAPPRHIIGGVLFTDLWDDVMMRVFSEWVVFTEHEDRKNGIILWGFNHRDKVASVASDAMAFSVRHPAYYAVINGRHSLAESDVPTREWIARMTKLIADANVEKVGVRLLKPTSISQGPGFDSVEELYGANLPRLRKLKAKYDPKKVWSKGWVIEPDFGA